MLDLTSNSQIINTALSIFLGGGAAGILYKIPTWFRNNINRFFVSSLTIDNSVLGNNRKLFFAFMKWVNSSEVKLWSNKVNYESNSFSKINLGDGVHYCIWNRRLYRIAVKTESSKEALSKGMTTVTISTLSLSKTPIIELFDRIFPVVQDNSRYTKYYDSVYWIRAERLNDRSFDSVIINTDIKEKILSTIDHFFNNEAYYRKYNIPYKLIILLYGPPGTGKTSIIKAIASHCNRNICIGKFHGVSEKIFLNQLHELEDDDILALEDIDTVSILKDREKQTSENTNNNELNYSTIINAFDGICELNNKIIIMTTNYIDHLDKAFIRPGRIDLCVEIPLFGKDEIKQYCDYVFPGNNFDLSNVKNISGATLQMMFMASKENPNIFYNELINSQICNDS